MNAADRQHRASCRCGGAVAIASGEPVRISVCHCLDCQKRAGSAFSAQVRFADVTVTGPTQTCRTVGAESGRWAEFERCATCGDQIAYRIEYFPDLTAIPLGAFDDPHAFVPEVSVYNSRRHPWVEITGIARHD